MNQKTIIAILGVVIVILLGTSLYFTTINKSTQTVPTTPKITQQPETRSNKVVSTDWKIYKNKEYGFQIVLTDNWKNYSVEKENAYKMGLRDVELTDPNRKRIRFCLKNQFGKDQYRKECLFAIDIISSKIKNEYEKDIIECEKEQKETGIAMYPCNEEIGRNNKYIFLGKVIVQDSSDKGAIALQDVSKILSSFQLTK